MSWLRAIFGSKSEQPAQSRHLGILVRGTLWHAEAAVSQLKMQGAQEGMTGAASVFEMPGGLKAQIEEGCWVRVFDLWGRWILVIPEDTYARHRLDFDQVLGSKPLDGRVEPSNAIGGFELLNVNRHAVERLCTLIGEMPPLTPAEGGKSQKKEASQGRVTVGKCSSCGRDLRVKAHAVRPTLHLTCKCGAKNLVTTATDHTSKPTSTDGA